MHNGRIWRRPASGPADASALHADASRRAVPAGILTVMASHLGPASFTLIKVRVAALVFCGDDVALIRHDRPAGSHYSPPGGNVEHGESLLRALRRELAEELRLSLDDATEPQLCWVQDQMVSRPGPTAPPRKLHMIFRCFVTSAIRATLATIEYDEQPDGSEETGIIEWVSYQKAASLPIFPLIGEVLARLRTPDADIGNPLLPEVNDHNYTWR